MTALKNEWFIFVQIAFRSRKFSGLSTNARLVSFALVFYCIFVSSEKKTNCSDGYMGEALSDN